MIGSVAVMGTGARALSLAEELATSGEVRTVTVYGQARSAPAHTVFARDLARYVFGLEPFEADTVAVMLAVPDAEIPELAMIVAAQGPAPPGCAAFHLSGVLPTEALAPLHGQGYSVGAFHPLGASSLDPADALRIGGSYVAVTGSPGSVSVARRLTDALDAEILVVPAARRHLVHAAIVMAGGYLEPLLGLSTRLMERAGITADEALLALVSVTRAALSNIEAGRPSPSTGHPVSEGDIETLALHLRALDVEDQRLYALFASEILRLEREALETETSEAMSELLSRYTGLEPTSVG